MHKKGLIAVAALILLFALVIWGMPFMTGRMAQQRMEHIVMVTATPVPVYEGDGPFPG